MTKFGRIGLGLGLISPTRLYPFTAITYITLNSDYTTKLTFSILQRTKSYVVNLNNLSRNTYHRGSVILFQEVKKPLILCTNTGVVCLIKWKSIGYQTLPKP